MPSTTLESWSLLWTEPSPEEIAADTEYFADMPRDPAHMYIAAENIALAVLDAPSQRTLGLFFPKQLFWF